MERLFEDLVAQLLRELDDEYRLVDQPPYPLDTLGRTRIQPDLVLRHAVRDVAVADTKYKILHDKGRLRNADAHQLITYCRRLGLSVGHLIYASGSLPSQPYDILEADVRLELHKINMSPSVEEIESDVAVLRQRLIADAAGIVDQVGA